LSVSEAANSGQKSHRSGINQEKSEISIPYNFHGPTIDEKEALSDSSISEEIKSDGEREKEMTKAEK
jgi:hypothetical protein